MTSTVTTDFREEYEAARETWLRKRFLWYAGVLIGFSLLVLVAQSLAFILSAQAREFVGLFLLQLGVGIVSLLIYVGSFVWAQRHLHDRARLLRLLFLVIVSSGALSLIATPLIFELSRPAIRAQLEQARAGQGPVETQLAPGVHVMTEPTDRTAQGEGEAGQSDDLQGGSPEQPAATPQSQVTETDVSRQIARQVVLGNSLGSIFFTHFFACLFIPWTARESLRPMVPLLILNAMVALFYIRLVPAGGSLALGLSPLVAGPGLLICLWRQRRHRQRFHFKMLKGRYGEIKKDLGFAREIHEAMFPKPLAQGPVRFDYRYEPMRQIGGDYLFSRIADEVNGRLPILNIAIVDVTGHGIGAALTVNRLHGEISRQFGEKPEARPGELLTGLNDYLHHTLSTHSVYATAIFLRFDPNCSDVAWASAGHPPAFLKAVDGTIDRLNSTTLVLGACKGEDFHPHEESTRFTPGDSLIAYTDGATEARDEKGRMLGVEGLLRIIASTAPDEEGGWASSVLREVDIHRFGPVQDDTLIVEVFRPLQLTSEAKIEAVTR